MKMCELTDKSQSAAMRCNAPQSRTCDQTKSSFMVQDPHKSNSSHALPKDQGYFDDRLNSYRRIKNRIKYK